MTNIIEVRGLFKHYGAVKAVDGISFDVREGDLFAFLGLNGAGKSTTINILCSILKKDSGSVLIDGCNLDGESDKIKRQIGIVFQNSVLDEQLSVEDNFAVKASFYGLRDAVLKERITELSGFLHFDGLLKRPFGKLSGGQRRRIDVARGLLHYPKVLFLDEPTTGLDPQTRRDVWNALEFLRKTRGTTVFLTTHYMEEANKADSVVIMDSGKIVAHDTPNNLKNVYSGDYIKLYIPKSDAADKTLSGGKYDFLYDKEFYRIKAQNTAAARDFILKNPSLAVDFEVIKGDMDDVFLNATGKKLSEDVL